MEMFNRFLAAALLAVFAIELSAAEFSVKTADTEPPKELGEAIRATLEAKAVQLLRDGKPALEMWFRPDVPLKNDTAKLDSLTEAALVGALAVREEGLRDYKDNDILKGVYTARFILQPQDGDHLGTADYNYFLALVAADTDAELAGLDSYKPLTKASGKLTPSNHPLIISLRPVSGEPGTTPAVTEPAPEHKAIRLNLGAKGSGGETLQVPCDLVFEGHGHIQ